MNARGQSPDRTAGRGKIRAGMTMVEVMAAMLLLSVTVALASWAVLATARVGRASGQQVIALHSRARLAEQFRADVNAAEGALLAPDGTGLVLHQPDGSRVAYSQTVGQVVRVVTQPTEIEGVVTEKSANRENYFLGSQQRVSFTLTEESNRRWLALELVESPDSPQGKGRVVRWEALTPAEASIRREAIAP